MLEAVRQVSACWLGRYRTDVHGVRAYTWAIDGRSRRRQVIGGDVDMAVIFGQKEHPGSYAQIWYVAQHRFIVVADIQSAASEVIRCFQSHNYLW